MLEIAYKEMLLCIANVLFCTLRFNHLANILSIVMLFILLCSLTTSTSSLILAQGELTPDNFSIIQISDTQYLSASFPELFNNLTSWIVNNANSLNVKMVVHTGDIVDVWDDTNQWINANNSMSLLLNNGIPYCWDAGNHDRISNDPASGWIGSKFIAFNASTMSQKSYWIDSIYDSKNTAVKFTFNDYKFIVVNVEYLANSSVITWMKGIFDNNIGSLIILATHDYLNGTIGYGYHENPPVWEYNLKSFLDCYPNVFLTLNGHDDTTGANNTRVNNREEIFFNRQGFDNREGSASVRIYSFDMNTLQVSVRTYCVFNSSFLTDPYNQFTFDIFDKPHVNPTSTSSFMPLLTSTPEAHRLVTSSPNLVTPLPSNLPTPTITPNQFTPLSKSRVLSYDNLFPIIAFSIIALVLLALLYRTRLRTKRK